MNIHFFISKNTWSNEILNSEFRIILPSTGWRLTAACRMPCIRGKYRNGERENKFSPSPFLYFHYARGHIVFVVFCFARKRVWKMSAALFMGMGAGSISLPRGTGAAQVPASFSKTVCIESFLQHSLSELTIPYPTGKKARWIAHILPMHASIWKRYHGLGRKGEVKRIANRKPSRSKLDQQILQAAILAVERLQQMLQDENASNGDVIKAASLIFDRLQEDEGEGKPTGDFEIIMKEDA